VFVALVNQHVVRMRRILLDRWEGSQKHNSYLI